MISYLFIITCGVLFYFRARLSIWTGVLFAELLLLSRLSNQSVSGLIFLWTLFFLLAIIFNFRGLRRKLITEHILPIYQRLMPKMSQTEKEAIDAGTVGFEAEIFQGNLNWAAHFNTPLYQLSEEEQSFIDHEVVELCAMIDDWQITHKLLDIPPQAWQFIKEKGFWAFAIPKSFAGKGFSASAQSEVLLRLYSRSTTLASIVAVPNSLGPGELLVHYGTPEQKNYYLPRLARGEEVPCFALTSPSQVLMPVR